MVSSRGWLHRNGEIFRFAVDNRSGEHTVMCLNVLAILAIILKHVVERSTVNLFD